MTMEEIELEIVSTQQKFTTHVKEKKSESSVHGQKVAFVQTVIQAPKCLLVHDSFTVSLRSQSSFKLPLNHLRHISLAITGQYSF